MIFQATNSPGATGFGLAPLKLVPGTGQLLQHGVERADTDAGQPDEARAGPQPGSGKWQGHWNATFTRKVRDESNRPVTCQARVKRPVPRPGPADGLTFATGLFTAALVCATVVGFTAAPGMWRSPPCHCPISSVPSAR
jgi:hypothetical protein